MHSDLDLGLYSAMLTWDLLPSEKVELGLGLGVTALDVAAKFTDLTNPGTVETDQVLPIPIVAGRLGFDVWKLELSALVIDIEPMHEVLRASREKL